MSDREIPQLPDRWAVIEINTIYHSNQGLLVSFSQTQIQLGILHDAPGKHLRAIKKGLVPPKETVGLSPQKALTTTSNPKS